MSCELGYPAYVLVADVDEVSHIASIQELLVQFLIHNSHLVYPLEGVSAVPNLPEKLSVANI